MHDGQSEHEDGNLHVWQCPWILRNSRLPEGARCGYVQAGPGTCPYDHAETVQLVEVIATVLCSDCGIPILADDCRDPDDRLVCGDCVMNYVGRYF